MQKKIKLLLIASVCIKTLYAQDSLTYQDALSTLLQNNFAIKIYRQNVELATNDVYIGKAGMLPKIDVTSSYDRSTQNTKQEFVTGNLVDKSGAVSTNSNAGIMLEWNLFDGMKMFISYDKLKILKILNESAFKKEVENQIQLLTNAYYDVSRKQNHLDLVQQLLHISEEQLKIATARFEVGSGRQQDIYQTKIGVNLQKSAKLDAEHQLRQAKLKLNELLARDQNTNYNVDSQIPVDAGLEEQKLQDTDLSKNVYIQYLETQKRVRELERNEWKAQQYPTISLNAAYKFGRTDNQAGFLLYNQNLGWTLGLGAQWNLFNGFQLKKEITNAHIRVLQSQLELESGILNSKMAIAQARDSYASAIHYLQIESENIQLADSNLKLVTENYRSGQSTNLEVQEAQRLYEESRKRFIDFRYEAKMAETELRKQTGTLLQ